jgi:hypothetical protein
MLSFVAVTEEELKDMQILKSIVKRVIGSDRAQKLHRAIKRCVHFGLDASAPAARHVSAGSSPTDSLRGETHDVPYAGH